MTTEPTELQLMELYRDWWKDSYGGSPNNQNTVIAAAFARHVLATFGGKADATAN